MYLSSYGTLQQCRRGEATHVWTEAGTRSPSRHSSTLWSFKFHAISLSFDCSSKTVNL
jgi:hypothetical protein